ncbi:MAG: aminotransferase class I/II-fold pyridoxal phosphate-dependent enzyme, partial [Muribaculaceae bacterium]|nr:aminotransferase class I/II-fold pyridoxal phosphate-dependent enzyme [Muribaculaceae bacterium]
SIVAWDSLMTDKLISMSDERLQLRQLSDWFRKELEKITGAKCRSESQIIPVHAGSASRAIVMASKLRDAGIDALPIRRPTVAAGTERLRLSLSAGLQREDLLRVLEVIKRI